jgi:hypothetical protein
MTVVLGIYPMSLATRGMFFAVKVFLYGCLYLPQSTMRFFLDWEFGKPARSKDQAEFERVFIKGIYVGEAGEGWEVFG